MTFRGFYSDEQGGFRPLRVPPSISKRKKKMKYTQGLFISKIKCAAKSGVHSIAGSALERRPPCVQSFEVCSTAKSCTFDRVLCVRSHTMRSIACNCLRILTAQMLKR